MAQQLQTSTSSPTTSVQTPELIIVERIDFHKLPTTSRGILLHTHALCMHRIIVIIINKIRRKKEKFTNSNSPIPSSNYRTFQRNQQRQYWVFYF